MNFRENLVRVDFQTIPEYFIDNFIVWLFDRRKYGIKFIPYRIDEDESECLAGIVG